MNLQIKVDDLKSRAEAIFPEMKKFKNDVDTLSNESLSVDNSFVEEIDKLKNELGVSPAEAIRNGTWPISGPGSDACHWCTAGGGA